MNDEFDILPTEEPKEQETPPAEETAPAEKPGFTVDTSEAEAIPDYRKTEQPMYDFETENKKKPRRHKRGIGWVGSTIYLVVVIAIAVGISIFALGILRDVTGITKDKKDAEVTVEIPQGATLPSIAKILKEKGLIDSEFGLIAYAKLTKTDYTYQPGTFTLNPKWGYKEMLKAMTVQQIVRETVKVRIIEGKTAEDIAALLEENGVCAATDFLDALETHDYTKYDFIKNIPDSAGRLCKLEGYLFPDTYEFYKESDVDQVVTKFLDNFDKRFDQKLRDKAKAKGMTLDEVVKFASVVQKEGVSEKTMKMVAGVFNNRMSNKNYQYLQSNATLSYAIGEPILWMSDEQMKNPSPYNSYTHKGLPPSAICNPGLQAIKAVLDPDVNSYYFFVTDEDRLFYFSKTANEHERFSSAIKNGTVDKKKGVK